jgi:hypothetical protein
MIQIHCILKSFLLVADLAPSADASLIADLLVGLHEDIESTIIQLQEMSFVETPTTGIAREF